MGFTVKPSSTVQSSRHPCRMMMMPSRDDLITATVNTNKPATVPKPHCIHHPFDRFKKSLASGIALTLLCCSITAAPPFVAPTHAASSRVIGEIRGSGLVFKDTLTVESFEDPKVQGVTLYISNFQRPITERLTKDFFTDPSDAGIGCAKTNKRVSIADTIDKSNSGEEVFEESKSILFKTLRVQRIYDEETNTVVYVSFNTRLDKNADTNKSRFKSSICAVNLN